MTEIKSKFSPHHVEDLSEFPEEMLNSLIGSACLKERLWNVCFILFSYVLLVLVLNC